MLAYAFDELFLEHQPLGPHPERPERALAVRDGLARAGVLGGALHVGARAATEEELGRVHTAAYVEELGRTIAGRAGWLDEDTYFSPRSFDAARTAAAAAIDLALAAVDGRAPRGFAVVRPPGHHAEPDHAMGFCLFNNAAVAAAAARAAGLARVAILDWDVHHGNGTQHAFYADPSVLYLSAHQSPFYPGTGAATEIGEGPGLGTTVNVPLPEGCGDREYAAAFDHVLAPALRAFRPELVIVSAGFDPLGGDPLAGMQVTPAGFARMARVVRQVADEVASGRLVVVLEGGYALDGLASAAGAVASVLAAPRLAADPAASAEDPGAEAGELRDGALAAIAATRRALAGHLGFPAAGGAA